MSWAVYLCLKYILALPLKFKKKKHWLATKQITTFIFFVTVVKLKKCFRIFFLNSDFNMLVKHAPSQARKTRSDRPVLIKFNFLRKTAVCLLKPSFKNFFEFFRIVIPLIFTKSWRDKVFCFQSENAQSQKGKKQSFQDSLWWISEQKTQDWNKILPHLRKQQFDVS